MKLKRVISISLICLGLVACEKGKDSAKSEFIESGSVKEEVAPKTVEVKADPTKGEAPPACSSDSDCLGGQICVPEAKECVSLPPGTCSSDQDCAVGEACDPAAKKCIPTDPGVAMTSDGVKNGDESDVDCGGSNPNKCAQNKACNVDDDCQSKLKCVNGLCALKLVLPCLGNECLNMIPPSVKSTQPENGAFQWGVGVSGKSAIKVVFSQPMDSSTINEKTFMVKRTDGIGGAVKGGIVVIGDNNVALFSQNHYLKANTSYTVTLTTGIKNEKGVSLAKDYSFSFTTANVVSKVTPDWTEDQVPTIKKTITVQLETSHGLVSFSKDSLSLNPPVPVKSFEITGDETEPYKIAFTLGAELADDTSYTVTLKKEAALASDYQWKFSTANCPDPELKLKWISKWCSYSKFNCEGGGCVQGFQKGQYIVSSGLYVMEWETKNADYVLEDCHDLNKKVNFEGEKGVVTFGWDGPKPGEYAKGFKQYFASWYERISLLLNEAYAAGGNAPDHNYRHPGKFTCKVKAYGVCGKTLEKTYNYACPTNL